MAARRRSLCGGGSLSAAAAWPDRYGLHREGDGWRFREWLPNATAVALVGEFNGWTATPAYQLRREENGDWYGEFPLGAMAHRDQYRLAVTWPGGGGVRIPAGARRVVRSTNDLSRGDVLFNAQLWSPAEPYAWRHSSPRLASPLIYEAHVGMAQEKAGIAVAKSVRLALSGELVPDAVNVQGGQLDEVIKPMLPLAEQIGSLACGLAESAVSRIDVEALGVAAEPREILLVVGGVRDRQIVLGRQAVGEEVVQDTAVLAAQHLSLIHI